MKATIQKRGSGFTLIEVLVAFAVLGIGLAGLAALLLGSIQGTASARGRTSAALLAESVAELVAISPRGVSAWYAPANSPGYGCNGIEECEPLAFAASNKAVWITELHHALPAATADICGEPGGCEGRAHSVTLGWSAAQADPDATNTAAMTLDLAIR